MSDLMSLYTAFGLYYMFAVSCKQFFNQLSRKKLLTVPRRRKNLHQPDCCTDQADVGSFLGKDFSVLLPHDVSNVALFMYSMEQMSHWTSCIDRDVVTGVRFRTYRGSRLLNVVDVTWQK